MTLEPLPSDPSPSPLPEWFQALISAEDLKAQRTKKYANRRRRDRLAPERDDSVRVVEFSVGGDRLGVDARSAVAVSPWVNTYPLLLAPPLVPAVVRFRGEVILIVALHRLKGEPVPPPGPDTRLIFVRWDQDRVALLADSVRGIQEGVPEDRAHADFSGWLAADAVRGIFPDGLAVLELPGLIQQVQRGLSG